MRKWLFILLITGALLPAHQGRCATGATSICLENVAVQITTPSEKLVPSELVKGEEYLLQTKGQSKLTKGIFTGLEKLKEGSTYLTFQIGYGKEAKIFSYLPGELHDIDWIKKKSFIEESNENDPQKELIKKAIIAFMDGHELSEMTFSPYKKLAKNKSVQVVGGMFSEAKNAKSTIDSLNYIDEQLESGGFKLPVATRIIMVEKPILPSLQGPYFIRPPIWNMFDGKTASTIMLHTSGYNDTLTLEPAVLAHERTHNVLRTTYSNDAWVSRNSGIQEALADFVAAWLYQKPSLFKDAKKTKLLRDIEKRNTGKKEEDSLLRVSLEAHDRSVFFSHVLWGLFKDIKAKDLKAIIDNLNLYRDDYDRTHETSSIDDVKLKQRQVYLYDVEYFMAMMHKSIKQVFNHDTAQKAQATAEWEKLTNSLGLDVKKTEQLGDGLAAVEHSSYDPSGKTRVDTLFQMSVFHDTVSGIVHKAIIMYSLLRIIQYEIEDEKKPPVSPPSGQ